MLTLRCLGQVHQAKGNGGKKRHKNGRIHQGKDRKIIMDMDDMRHTHKNGIQGILGKVETYNKTQ